MKKPVQLIRKKSSILLNLVHAFKVISRRKYVLLLATGEQTEMLNYLFAAGFDSIEQDKDYQKLGISAQKVINSNYSGAFPALCDSWRCL